MAGEDVKAALVRHGALLLDEQGLAGFTGREVARRAGVSHGAPRRYFPTLAALLSAIAATGFADLRSRMAAASGDPAVGAAAGGGVAAPDGAPAGSAAGDGMVGGAVAGDGVMDGAAVRGVAGGGASARSAASDGVAGGGASAGSAACDGVVGGAAAGGGVAGGGGAARAALVVLARVYVEFARERPAMFELMFRHDLLEGSGERLREHSTPIFVSVLRLVELTGVREPGLTAVDLWAGVHGLAVLASRRALELITDESPDGLLERQLAAHLEVSPLEG
ncbi:hypothetical protein Aab01nite_42240 [Paractinoplanes abujensis]|uniref:AcrR family transcriptional regulator n=1 Tax=Paractinoplanes abujensis TaxID=882441 RepID=A0A7W7CSZ5_9ACTN|nr:TetR-like C-terminal domain-containing protein [Actinoplanes abujensis]MBB4694152.1 AcrR family transcriptional regulator [Actinoplanes abujensis]GID20634.1 hypothetical protein Aab01nite_42240 [Actinoplanes abujensis]